MLGKANTNVNHSSVASALVIIANYLADRSL